MDIMHQMRYAQAANITPISSEEPNFIAQLMTTYAVLLRDTVKSVIVTNITGTPNHGDTEYVCQFSREVIRMIIGTVNRTELLVNFQTGTCTMNGVNADPFLIYEKLDRVYRDYELKRTLCYEEAC